MLNLEFLGILSEGRYHALVARCVAGSANKTLEEGWEYEYRTNGLFLIKDGINYCVKLGTPWWVIGVGEVEVVLKPGQEAVSIQPLLELADKYKAMLQQPQQPQQQL